MPDQPPAPSKKTAEPASSAAVIAYSVLGFFVLMIGTCIADNGCPGSGGDRSCGRQYLAYSAAEDRREALEERAQSAIGLERAIIAQELAEARRLEQAARREWRACENPRPR